jgi:NAD(P)-dependent dehydrogenase (short-subunit alcohol dehydrogenase family)
MSKSILVVGGNSGIGHQLVQTCVAEGHDVYAASRSGTAAEGIKSFLPLSADFTIPTELIPPVLNGFVYLPGTIRLKPFHRITPEEFQADWEVNFLGAAKLLQQVFPALKQAQGDASVVLFSTVAVPIGMPFHASIASAKGAVEALGRSLAAEWAPNIRVNVVAPSLHDTPLAQGLLSTPEKKEAAAKRHPLQQVGSPDDVAALVSFLLNPASKFMTGQVLRPDGGLSSVRT